MATADSILQMFKTNEEKAFRLFYDCYFQDLHLLADHIINNSDEASDLVQDFYIDFWINRRFEKITGKIEAYIFTSVKNLALRHIRNTRKQQQLHLAVNEEKQVEDTLPDDSEYIAIENLYRAINQLPKERRKIFLMICMQGMSYQETADSLGLKLNTVKTQMTRSVRHLRETLDKKAFDSILFLLVRAS